MKHYLVLLILLFGLNTSKGGVLANKTRVIYHEQDKEQLVLLANINPHPIVVQTWTDYGEGDPESTAPFVAIPPVFYLPIGKTQGIKLIHDGDQLPKNTESVFWLNLYEIPPNLQHTALNSHHAEIALATNTQLKVFYRPATLGHYPSQLSDKISFKLKKEAKDWVLICTNPLSFHISFTQINYVTDQGNYLIKQEMDMMTLPLSSRSYKFDHQFVPQQGRVVFSYLNDAGFSVSESIQLDIS